MHTKTHSPAPNYLEFGLQAPTAGSWGRGVELGQVGLQGRDLQLSVPVQVVLQQGLEDEDVLHLWKESKERDCRGIVMLHQFQDGPNGKSLSRRPPAIIWIIWGFFYFPLIFHESD